MADFTGEFWSWFIAITTLISIAALFWLNRWMTTPRNRKETSAQTTGHVWDRDLKELNNPLPRWWLNLFYLTLVFGLVYLVLFPGLGAFPGVMQWTSKNRYDREMAAAEARLAPLYRKYLDQDVLELAQNAEAVRTGERLFVNYCAGCHGSDARGAPGYPNLRDDDWLWGGAPAAIKASILDGRSGMMPAWGAVLGSDGVANVAEYVYSLSGRDGSDPVKLAAGREKFQQLCVACHGADGRGNPALGAPNLADSTWLYGGNPRAVAESIANGRNGRMPAHNEFLGEAKAHVLAAYIYSLSHGPPAEAKR